MLDDIDFAKLCDALIQHAGGHRVAALLQLGEGERSAAKLPQNSQGPAAAEQVEQRHQRASGARTTNRFSRLGDHGRGLYYDFRSGSNSTTNSVVPPA